MKNEGRTGVVRGTVQPGQVMTLVAAKAALGVGDWGFRKIREQGLPVVKQGRQSYVMSDDVIALFEKLRDEQSEQATEVST